MKKNSSQILIRAFVLLLFLCVSAHIASAEPFQTIINNGSSQNRVDIAVLGDGYTAGQLQQYQSNVLQFFQSVFTEEPYKEYQRYYNVHRIDVVSNQSGADHPERNPPLFVDTALDATYNCSNIQRLICVSSSKVNAVINRTLPAGYFDVILVVVNDPEYGGSGGSIAVASINGAAVDLILHEVGHSFGLLADEYDGGGPSCNPNVEPVEPNATRETQRALIKWNIWIDASTPIPTTSTIPALPGLYQGSKYCTIGLYRPTSVNKMRALGFPFEQINVEQHVKRIYNFVSPLDSSAPSGATVSMTQAQTQSFSASSPQPLTHTLSIEWRVDGQNRGGGSTFDLVGSTLTPGPHTVQAIVRDITPFVRNDPNGLLDETRTWTVNVQSSSKTDYDFDGDRKADVSVFRPTDGIWYILLSGNNNFRATQFGVNEDRITPADFDGDGKTDIAVFRPSSGVWYMLRSSDGNFLITQFGISEDLPAPGDFDGDGKADIAVFRPSTGVWYSLRSNAGLVIFQFGLSGDVPVVGDYDGDGKSDLAVWRPSDGIWYLQRSGTGFTAIQFGLSNDKPTPADYDGDGKTDVAVYRSNTGIWYLLRSASGFSATQFGIAEDRPTAGDYDGDGKADIAVWRPSSGIWYLQRSAAGFSALQFGVLGDRPIPAAYIP
jgi:hypothetical protein